MNLILKKIIKLSGLGNMEVRPFRILKILNSWLPRMGPEEVVGRKIPGGKSCDTVSLSDSLVHLYFYLQMHLVYMQCTYTYVYLGPVYASQIFLTLMYCEKIKYSRCIYVYVWG